MSERAVEKAVKVATAIEGHEMDICCPHCIGGWWVDSGGEVLLAVHDSECPRQDGEPPAVAQ